MGAGEITQWLKALTTLSKDPGSSPRIYRAAHSDRSCQLWGMQCPLLTSVDARTHVVYIHTLMHIREPLK